MNTLLPPNATDFESSMEAVTARVGAVDVTPIGELWDPQTCPVGILPWLAFALDVDPWNTSWTEAQQRAAIASSIEVHRIRGTVGALKRALQAIGYECEINEDTGQAFTFRVLIDASTYGLTDQSVYDDATAIALRAKPARSYLAGVDGLLHQDADPTLTSSAIGGSDTIVLPNLTLGGLDADGIAYSGGALAPVINIILAPQFQTVGPTSSGSVYAGGAFGLSLEIAI